MSIEKVYPGKRLEALLWASLFIVICPGIVLLQIFVLPFLGHRSFTSNDILIGGAFFFVVTLTSGNIGWQIAKWRGTTVILCKDSIKILEWYGRKKRLRSQLPISISRQSNIRFIGKSYVYVLPMFTWNAVVGKHAFHLRLDDIDDPFAEADFLEHRLQIMASINSV
jgi:hypothetical protein